MCVLGDDYYYGDDRCQHDTSNDPEGDIVATNSITRSARVLPNIPAGYQGPVRVCAWCVCVRVCVCVEERKGKKRDKT